MIKIYSKDNQQRCIAPTANGQQEKQLQGDNVLSLTFTLYEFIQLDVNDYATFLGERYWLLERYKPRMKNTKEWEYNLTLYGVESLVKRFLVINYTDNEDTPIFTLTAPASEHAKIILTSINKAIGRELFRLGEVKQTENLVIDYKGTYCNEALDLLAKAAKTEFLFEEGTTLNISRAQYGEPITLGYQKGLISLEREKADNVKFYTRLFPLGSTKNIDPDKYKHRRLQLPNGQKYVDKDTDKYGIVHHFEETAFADIYPRRIGVVSAVRSEERKSKEGKPFTVYYFKDKDLNFNPNEYKIGGYVMRVAFQEGSELAGQGTSEEHYFEVNYNDQAKEFEIITIFPSDDLQVPGGVLVPKTGDKYILSHLRMPDEYYPLAEKELLEAVKKYNDEHFVDNAVYKADTDHVWVEQNHAELYIGRRVRLENKEYFAPLGYRNSRITKVTRSIELPTLATIEISDAVPQGKIATMESSITDVRHYIGEVTNTIPDIIGSGDDTRPTEHNVFSAKRSLSEFLSKKHPDTAQAFIKFLAGIGFQNAAKIDGMGNAFLNSIQLLGSERFLNGFGVWLDENGRAHGQIDFLHVFGKAIFNTVEIRELSYVGGDIGLSKASGKIIKVVKVEKGWKCYLKTDDGTIQTFNNWKGGDQAKCQTFNLRKGITNNAANRYYWRCVEEVAEKTDTEEAYIVLSNVEHFFDPMGTDEPREGDTLVLCGHNRTWDLTHGITESDTSRMNFTQITTSKEEGGTIEVYRNIQDFKMTLGNAIFHLSSQKLYVNTNSLVWLSGGGEQVANMLFRGDWYKGVVAYKNEVWYSKGAGWLSLTDNNTDEPSASSPKWQCRIQKGKDGGTGLRVEGFSSPNSSFYAEGQTSWKATYELHVWHNDKEITNELPSTRFVWERYSDYTQGDEAWNATHKNVGYKINVTYEDLKGDTTFICKLMSEDGNNIITSRTF